MNHATMNAGGSTRWSPRSEVGDDVMPAMKIHLADILRHPTRIPSPEGTRLMARASQDDYGLLVTIMDQGVSPSELALTFVVVEAGRDDVIRPGWNALGGQGKPPTPGPWCLVLFNPQWALHLSPALEWLADYERCVAWAWLDGNKGEQPHPPEFEGEKS